MPNIIDINAHAIEIPLKDAFETAKGRKTSSPSVAIELRLSNGIVGLGSATPVGYVTGEDIDGTLASVAEVADSLRGCDPTRYRRLFQILAEKLPSQHSARAGLEIAVVDAFCKLRGLPMYEFFGGSTTSVETDLTIPIVAPEVACELAKSAASSGFRFLKIKVGGPNLDEDTARVIAASEGAPGCGIRLDANQGFEPDSAVRFVSHLLDVGVRIDMLEQPVDRDDLDGLRYVTEHVPTPVFADESAVTPSDVLKLVGMDAVDGINVKLMKCGLSGALDIILICRAAGKELMLGCMIETGIGISAAVHLACGTGAFGRSDLDAHLLAAPGAPFSLGFAGKGALLLPADDPGHGSVPLHEFGVK